MSGPYVYCEWNHGRDFAVGFYVPGGKWEAESNWNSREEAAARVHYLNGGTDKPASTRHGDGSTGADAKAVAPSRPPLVKLPSGRSIDPDDVTQVGPEPAMGKVAILFRVGPVVVEDVPPGQFAQEFADGIVAQINAARQGGGA